MVADEQAAPAAGGSDVSSTMPLKTEPAAGGGNRFSLIEAGRGIAALLVVLHHAGNMVALPRFYGVHPLGGHLRNFNVGVDFFFVLSGFIITWVHWKDIGVRDRLRSYGAKRFLRVYPPCWAILIPLTLLYAAFPGAGTASKHDPVNIVLSFVLIPYTSQPVLGVAWTLTHEIFFYGLFAAVIAFGMRMMWVMPVWAACIVAANLTSALPYPLSFLLSPVNLEFIMGVGAAAALRRGVRLPAVPAALIGAVGFGLLMLFATRIQENMLGARLAFGGCATLFVLGAVRWESGRRVPLPRIVLLLGSASYAIYLAHSVAISFGTSALFRIVGRDVPITAMVALVAVLGLLAGIAFHYLVERPGLRHGERLLSRMGLLPRGATHRPTP